MKHIQNEQPDSSTASQMLDPAVCWQALYSRDPRFDGRFFAAAKSTGLYCRNVCPVPFAKPENIILYPCAAAAEAAGFRPCKRCQPQASPGTPAWLGSSAVVSRAMRLIMDGALNESGVERLAERLGIGSRHLRRLFVQHLGASPIRIAITQKVHLAKRLLDETEMPITEIAHCTDFKSIREFNHVMRLSTGQTPSSIRKARGVFISGEKSGLLLRLVYRPPLDWTNIIEFLKKHAIPGVEMVTNSSYARTVQIGSSRGMLHVTFDLPSSRLLACLELNNLAIYLTPPGTIGCGFTSFANGIGSI
jgi:AraC family transcriptional regulator of adaptative response / DNA-3-methyladenine glycosylase II